MKIEDTITISPYKSSRSRQLIIKNKSRIEKEKSTSYLSIRNRTIISKEIKNNSNINKTNTKFKNFENIKHNKVQKITCKKIDELPTINPLNLPPKQKIYFYKIYKIGNDPSTIKKCFEHRINWKPESEREEEEKISFIWAPISSQINYFKLAYELRNEIMVNHFEYHYEISNKLNMFRNMMIYCENKNLNVLNYLPLTILIEYDMVGFIRQYNSFSYIFNNIEHFIKQDEDRKIRYKNKYRNFFYVISPDNKIIGLRTGLFIPKSHYDGKNFWLLKAMNLNRGLGIKLIDSTESCEKYIRAYYQGNINKCVKDSQNLKDIQDINKRIYFILPKIKEKNNINKNEHITSTENINKNNIDTNLKKRIDYTKIMRKCSVKKGHYKSNKIILQKYIEKPLLYNGRKFDTRFWVLLTHKMEIYLFKEGHLKATSFNFTLENIDLYVHLTNYSVQKYSDKFQAYEEGNEISLEELQKSLKDHSKLITDLRNEIIPKIKNIILISLQSVSKLINKYNREKCFEIFGYDFMFDYELNPFLIEINTNPGLEISSPLIQKLVPRMIDDALRLTIDDYFDTKYSKERLDHNGNYISPFPVDGYNNNENLFELIGTLEK